MAVTAPHITAEMVQARLKGQKADVSGAVFKYLLWACLGIVLVSLIALIYSVSGEGLAKLNERGLVNFLSAPFSIRPQRTGVYQGIVGTVTSAGIVAAVAFPLGVCAAIYLEEYASDNWFTRLIDVVTRNLAGVPAVVYGLLGLAIFVQGPFQGLTGGRSVLAAGLTLAVLALPIVIITSAEAIRAVPQSLREGGYGVGATRWEVTRTLVLPNALPAILTGTILGLARALGEAAPLLLVGAKDSVFSGGGWGDLRGDFTALPSIITDWSTRPAEAWNAATQAAILVTLVIVLGINTVGILLRNHFEKKKR
jgi:phosphate transport system permease protein